MKVQTPAMTAEEVAAFGPIVAGTCTNDIQTFRLVPKTEEEMKSNDNI